jgi:hypothetical protein
MPSIGPKQSLLGAGEIASQKSLAMTEGEIASQKSLAMTERESFEKIARIDWVLI